ncbi:MAG: AtpZ/AtpI family protein [Flavobacteriaceae bacterium]|nr:AtpZ/AtpI family protein [Flavobacteriaceae bacterium]MDG1911413.1 AtpZ/AtpI family protein [Flavobacteriaceae bacterium]
MKKQPNRWLIFSSLAFQIGIIMYGAVKLGIFLDAQYETTRFALILSVFGLIIVLWLIYKQSKSFWNNP